MIFSWNSRIKRKCLLVILLCSLPLSVFAAPSKQCDEFIATIHKQKLTQNQAIAMSKGLKFRKKDGAMRCEVQIQSDKALMRRWNIKFPDLNKPDMKIGHAAKLNKADIDKFNRQAADRVRQGNLGLMSEYNRQVAAAAAGDCSRGPVITEVLTVDQDANRGNVATMGSMVVLNGHCFTGNRAFVRLRNYPVHLINQLDSWSSNQVIFTLPEPPSPAKQPSQDVHDLGLELVIDNKTARGRLGFSPFYVVQLTDWTHLPVSLLNCFTTVMSFEMSCDIGDLCSVGFEATQSEIEFRGHTRRTTERLMRVLGALPRWYPSSGLELRIRRSYRPTRNDRWEDGRIIRQPMRTVFVLSCEPSNMQMKGAWPEYRWRGIKGYWRLDT